MTLGIVAGLELVDESVVVKGFVEVTGVRLEDILGLEQSGGGPILNLVLLATESMRLISSLDKRPLSLVAVMQFDLQVALPWAEVLGIPPASVSQVTSIWGTPRGVGGMQGSSNLLRGLLSLVWAR